MPSIHNGIGTTFRSAAFGGAPAVNPDFVSTWDTTQAGSASDTVVLPLLSGGTYSGTIDWGDGSSDPLSYANRTHVYAASGTYTITISGSDIQGWSFNGTTDYLKITDISNWGNLTITFGYRAFRGCSNLDISATDAPTLLGTQCHEMFQNCTSLTTPDFSKWDVSGMTYMVGMFGGCTSFNGNVTTWDVSNVTNTSSMFVNCLVFNQDISGWDVSSVTAFGSLFANTGMFQNCVLFNQDISGWDVSSGQGFGQMFRGTQSFNQSIGNWTTTSATNMYGLLFDATGFDQSLGGLDIATVSDLRDIARNITLSTSNYDSTLIAWEAQLQAAYPSGAGYPYTIATNFGSSQYTLGGAAEAARTSLISTFGWTISDGGGV